MSQEQQSVSNVEEESMSNFEEESVNEQEMSDEWETLKADNDYEINTTFPFQIRKKANKKIIAECLNKNGYIVCSLNQIQYKKHRLIAQQFIPNDDPELKKDIDHINHNRSDNHIENLRWVSRSNNLKNKTSNNNVVYEYFDKIDDNAIEITDYGQHHFEFYYYVEKDDSFYFYNGKQYRKLHVNCDKRNGSYFVNMVDTTNKYRGIRLNKFKKLYDIEF